MIKHLENANLRPLIMDATKLKSFVNTLWEDAVVPSLTEYIRIPNKSPAFDKDWAAHGYMDDAVKLMEAWARARISALKGATLEVVRLPEPHAGHLHGNPGRDRTTRSCSTAISTSSRNSPAGPRASVRGRPCARATSSTAAAAPTTATRCTARSRRCSRSTISACRTRARSC